MVDAYSFGSITIDGKTYDHDVIYYRGEVTRWWREKGHKVKQVDIQGLIATRPETVVFGTGAMGFMRIGKKALAALQQAGVKVEAERSARAVERFNALEAEGHDVALAIHLTC